jgi:glycosyltransferase involved in cell wall biosynthesis
MRIALLCTDPSVVFGEGQRCPARFRGLAIALARAGHDVTVVCAAHDDDSTEATPNLEVRALRMPASVREIDWHFSRIDPEVVIERLVPGSTEGARASGESGIPHVYDLDGELHGDALTTSSSVRGALPEALALSRGAITNGPEGAARVRDLTGPAHPVLAVPGAADVALLESPSSDSVALVASLAGLPEGGLRIGFFGDLGEGCGLLPLVAAMSELPASRGARLLVVGDGPERNAALRAADSAGVALVLCGRVPYRELPAHLALCHIVVAPADRDGGVAPSLLEAMAMRRAVVATLSDAVREVARDGHDACLVPANDPAALGAALVRLADDPLRRERLGQHARESVRTRHTWDARAAAIGEFLQGLLPETSRVRENWDAPGERRAFSG